MVRTDLWLLLNLIKWRGSSEVWPDPAGPLTVGERVLAARTFIPTCHQNLQMNGNENCKFLTLSPGLSYCTISFGQESHFVIRIFLAGHSHGTSEKNGFYNELLSFTAPLRIGQSRSERKMWFELKNRDKVSPLPTINIYCLTFAWNLWKYQ